LQNQRQYRDKIASFLLTSSLLSFTLCFFGPLNLFIGNILEIPLLLSEIWFWFLGVSIIFAALLFVLQYIISLKLSWQRVNAVFMGISILFWIQGNFLVWKYGSGVLDGQAINWSLYHKYGIFDSIFWLVVFLVFCLKYRQISRWGKQLSTLILLIQSITLAINIFQMPEVQAEEKRLVIDGTYKYSFSNEKNVIIFVLDTLQTDVFQEIIEEDAELKKSFDGFTYFRNALGGYPTTYPSIPLILTGQYYDNSIPLRQFVKETYLANSLPKTFKENGFRVELYPHVNSTIYMSEEIASNIKLETTKRTASLDNIKQLYKLALFRYTPHYLKRYFSDIDIVIKNRNDFKEDDLTFAKNMSSKAKNDSNENVFKFIHLKGAHAPYILDENLQKRDLGSGRNAYKTQAKAAIKITSIFLNKLKEIGVYDNSLIVIASDHGSGFKIENTELNMNIPSVKNDDLKIFTSYVSSLATLLIKPFDSVGEMQISDAPVSTADIAHTVVNLSGVGNRVPGIDIFELTENTDRTRRFFYYSWTHEYWKKEFLPPMTEFHVDGFSWLFSSWKNTGMEYRQNGNKVVPPVYKYNSIVEFGRTGNASSYMQKGWSAPEEEFTWSLGNTTTLSVPLESADEDIIFTATVTPLLHGNLKNQRVSIYIGNDLIDTWNVTATGEYSIHINKRFIENSTLLLTFYFHDAATPEELGKNNDKRMLALAFRSFYISKANSTE